MTRPSASRTGVPEGTSPSGTGIVVRLPLALIDYSPTNPRTSCDERELRELAASITAMGLLQPITVRAVAEGRYEVIAGERRTRAHRLAKLDSIDAIVRDMSDADVRTMQTIENLQRADLAPLDEAEGFAALLAQEEPPITVADLAARIGKSAAYVRGRVQLTHLVNEAKTAARKDTLSLRVALHLARLTEADQRDLLPWAIKADWSGHRPSEARVAQEIERRYFLDLARAPFDRTDTTLVPGKPACVECPLRTGFDRSLFPDIKTKDTCTDRTCFAAKRDAQVDRMVLVQLERALSRGDDPRTVVRVSTAWEVQRSTEGVSGIDAEMGPPLGAREYTVVSRGENCEHTQPAVVIDGIEAGKTIRICVEATCRTHRAFSVSTPDTANARAEERARQAKVKQERVVLRHILDATVAAVPLARGPMLASNDLRVVAAAMLDRLWHEHVKQIVHARGLTPPKSDYGTRDYAGALRDHWTTQSDADVVRCLVEMALASDARPSTYGGETPDRLLAMAKRNGVDVTAIRRACAASAKEAAASARTRSKRRGSRRQQHTPPETTDG